MGARFIGCDRDQVFLMPPSLRDWVPEGHLVWTVLDAVAELDLSAVYADYRDDGRGRPAYEPSMMVARLLYAYARGNRSSRGIERACVEDIAYRVVTGNLAPDHSTIAEFRCRHERPLGEVFSGVLGSCARGGAGFGWGGGDRRDEDGGQRVERRQSRLWSDRQGDPRRGGRDRPPRGRALRLAARRRVARAAPHRDGRRQALREAKEGLARERDETSETPPADEHAATVELDPGQLSPGRGAVGRGCARGGARWTPNASARLGRSPRTGPIGFLRRAGASKKTLDVEHASHAAYDAWRARGVAADGSRRMAPGMVKPQALVLMPAGLMNVTDHDSRPMRTHGYKPLQGYNAQLVVNDGQVVIAAELTTDSPDFGHLEPTVRAAQRELQAVELGDPRRRGRRRGLLAPAPDRDGRRRRYPGARRTRLQPAPRRPPRVDRWPL
jgi:transposase